ncbi:MAG: amino acid adenylation domain-containing protein [Candidatus Electrothrix sp. LOE1_4_5]|nr:amino acid adenylation domain-containing protein [Candidatus Electrothrix gigas]
MQLLKQEYRIVGIVSSDQSVAEWAKDNEIDFQLRTDNILEFLTQQSFDYLFSIANISILPSEIIRLPSRYAINYHDALLPAYAGLNATSWAIINQEKRHGVTWHIMADKVDSGEVLKQAVVEIYKEETAFTLNGKCYEAAIDSFSEMIRELRHEKHTLIKQDVTKRSYFSRSCNSGAGFLISWNRDAHEIDALIRGLDFGPYPNPLGAAKFFINNSAIIVSQTKVTNSLSTLPPGTVAEIQGDVIRVATASYNIELHKLMTIKGQSLSVTDFVTQFALHEGTRFEEVASDELGQLADFDAIISKHEAFWIDRLSNLQPLELPYIDYTHLKKETNSFKTEKILVPNGHPLYLSEWTKSDFILTAFIAYLAKIGENSTFDIEIKATDAEKKSTNFKTLFSSHIPCRIKVDKGKKVKDVFLDIQKQIESSRQYKTYLHDVFSRYPEFSHLKKRNLLVAIEKKECLNNFELIKNCDLTFTVQEDGRECEFLYNTESLSKDAVSEMADQFVVFIKNIIDQDEVPIARLSLLSDEAYQKILTDWNNTQSAYPDSTCLHQLFEIQVDKTPDAVAVVFENQQMTYRELNEKANQVAHYLQTLDVGTEILVGLCIDRSLDMLIGLLGILKAGGAYLPLDPTYPSARLSFMLEDAGVGVLLTQQKWLDKLSDMSAGTLTCLDSQWKTIAQESKNNLEKKLNSDNLIYVIYTSGSTGRPKGVQITHRALVNFLYAMRQSVGLSKEDILLAVTTLSFDIAGLELYLPLITGAQIILASRETAVDGVQLLDKITSSKATVMQATPATWQMLINVGWQKTPYLKILCGGEALSCTLAEQLTERGESVWNLYGPTETTVWSSVYQVNTRKKIKNDRDNSELIGRPLANTQLYILDQFLQPTPIGIPGELHIGGDGLARGYLNRPELTAEKFIANHFSKNPDSRLYKTGDLVRYRPDGNIEYITRIDHQVKIRGFRIEIGEIEAQLRKHEAVQEAVVVDREYPLGSQSLIAYVVPTKTQSTDITDELLLNHLRELLPDYMVPSLVIMVDAMPLTPNGKIDRRNLPLPEMNNSIDFNQAPLAISSDFSTEQTLTAIWCNVLGRQQIDADEKFFEIGGNSLLATQVITQIRDVFSLLLPVSKLFESSTIAQLTLVLDSIVSQKKSADEYTGSNYVSGNQIDRVSEEQEGDRDTLEMLKKLANNEIEEDEVVKAFRS